MKADMVSAAVVAGVLLVALGGEPASALSSRDERVLLERVSALTFRRGYLTSGRRTKPVPQMNCVGGECASDIQPDVVQCANVGKDSYGDVQWRCEANLPSNFELGTTDVVCEGYASRDDPYILSGSCGLEYTVRRTGNVGGGYQRNTGGGQQLHQDQYQRTTTTGGQYRDHQDYHHYYPKQGTYESRGWFSWLNPFNWFDTHHTHTTTTSSSKHYPSSYYEDAGWFSWLNPFNWFTSHHQHYDSRYQTRDSGWSNWYGSNTHHHDKQQHRSWLGTLMNWFFTSSFLYLLYKIFLAPRSNNNNTHHNSTTTHTTYQYRTTPEDSTSSGYHQGNQHRGGFFSSMFSPRSAAANNYGNSQQTERFNTAKGTSASDIPTATAYQQPPHGGFGGFLTGMGLGSLAGYMFGHRSYAPRSTEDNYVPPPPRAAGTQSYAPGDNAGSYFTGTPSSTIGSGTANNSQNINSTVPTRSSTSTADDGSVSSTAHTTAGFGTTRRREDSDNNNNNNSTNDGSVSSTTHTSEGFGTTRRR